MKFLRTYVVAMVLLFGRFKTNRRNNQWIAGASTGLGLAGLGATQILSLFGFSVVTHSSGAAILTGAGGYIAGTYGLASTLALLTFPFAIIVFVAMIAFGLVVRLKRK